MLLISETCSTFRVNLGIGLGDTMQASQWINLSGKVAHITGGAKGIGRGIATAFKMAGATVVISDANQALVEQTANELEIHPMILDVTDPKAVERAFNQTKQEHGSLDILVNNAGVYAQYGGPVEQISDEMWRTLWAVNVDGVFYCCRAAATIMKAQDNGGRIINISSTQAMTPGSAATPDRSTERSTSGNSLQVHSFQPRSNANLSHALPQ